MCIAYFKGEAPTKAQVNEIAQGVKEQKNWSKKAERSRLTEVRAVVRSHARLGKVCTIIAAKRDSFTWHDAVKVGRMINNNPKKADSGIVSMFTATKADKPPPTDLDTLLAMFEKVTAMKPKKGSAADELRTHVINGFQTGGYEVK